MVPWRMGRGGGGGGGGQEGGNGEGKFCQCKL